MALLKKIKASSLMETMVATVLIVIIFMVASLVMNSLVVAKSKAGDSQRIREHLKKLEYQYLNQQIETPHAEQWENWEITVLEDERQDVRTIELKALEELSNKQVTSYLIAKE